MQSAESRSAVLEFQLTESRRRTTEEEQATAQANERCQQLQLHNGALALQLADAKDAAVWEERVASLDQAVFGDPRTSTRRWTTGRFQP